MVRRAAGAVRAAARRTAARDGRKRLTGKQIADLIADLTERVRKAGFVVGQVVMLQSDLDGLW